MRRLASKLLRSRKTGLQLFTEKQGTCQASLIMKTMIQCVYRENREQAAHVMKYWTTVFRREERHGIASVERYLIWKVCGILLLSTRLYER